jgi:predicted DNA-binding WGR domain protein
VKLDGRLELELVDHVRDLRRYYWLEVAPDRQIPLYPGERGGFVLVITRGRLEPRRTRIVRREPFKDLDKLDARWRELVARRRRHGYLSLEQA